VDRELVESKLESLRRCVKRIEAKTPGNIELLRGDCDLQGNTAVHAYQQLDYDIVYSIITQHLNDFREYASQILRFMNREG
jgi:hypothetical protein